MNDEKGIALTETIVTIVVAGLALTALALGFLNGFMVVAEIREQAIATQVCQEEMERIRTMPFAQVSSLSGTFQATGLGQLISSHAYVTIEPYGVDENIRKVTVSVSWTSRRGRSLSRNLVSLVTKGGINRQ